MPPSLISEWSCFRKSPRIAPKPWFNLTSRILGSEESRLSGPVGQSEKSPTADPGVESLSSIPFLSHTFVEIDHEIISTVILLLPLIQEVVSYK